MSAESQRLRQLCERLRQGIQEQVEKVYLNGHPVERLPNNLNLGFAFVKADALMIAMKDVAVSSSSACTSAEPEPSYVIRALGVREELAEGSLRFGLGRFTTKEEVDFVIDEVVRAVHHLRSMSPCYEMHRQSLEPGPLGERRA
jgi:cysteine desulfurase